MNIVIGIATTGRPFILKQAVEHLSLQTRLPDRIIVCAATLTDLPELGFDGLTVECITSAKGSSHQRNAILKASADADLIVFFDDDFLAHRDYLAECEALFEREADIVVATGIVIADGVNSPGIAYEDAVERLASTIKPSNQLDTTYGAYGCNMVVRAEPIEKYKCRFDENLPLYGWQEDIDLSRQLSKYGRVVRYFPMIGIHLGHKGGRTSGVRTGYSQIANPWYLVRKGTLSARFGGNLALRNLLANLARAFSPEPWVDRRGRLRGNFIALFDILLGRCHPTKILRM